jgi:hypothetical protein
MDDAIVITNISYSYFACILLVIGEMYGTILFLRCGFCVASMLLYFYNRVTSTEITYF